MWDRWIPVILLVAGGILLFGVGQQQEVSLRAPLSAALPQEIRGMRGSDVLVSAEEAAVAGFTDYALRVYGDGIAAAEESPVSGAGASIYLGFYDSQTRGRTIHSPRNCLPGAGWEALSSSTVQIDVRDGNRETVNRYILQNGEARALVLYWYQGRGRVAHNEYRVKWDLLRDAALERRTDEALVRIVVPLSGAESEGFELAHEIARDLIPDLDEVLP